jgi:hypothetical protein
MHVQWLVSLIEVWGWGQLLLVVWGVSMQVDGDGAAAGFVKDMGKTLDP